MMQKFPAAVADSLVRARVIESDHYAERLSAEWTFAAEGPAVWARVIAKKEAA